MGLSGGRTRRGLVRASLTAAVLVATLAGCSRAEPSVVAYVGDTRVTQSQLDDAVAGVTSTLEDGQQVSREAVVNVLIQGVIADKIAAANNITITNAQRDALIKGSNLAPLLNVPLGLPVAYDAADQQLVAQKLGSDAYLAALAKQPVTLNPRFGVLDPSQKTIITDKSGALAAPAAPTPEPTS